MSTLSQETNALIIALPIDGNTKVKVEMLQAIFNKLNLKSDFTGEWSDLINKPTDLYFTRNHRANIREEVEAFTLVAESSGYIVFVNSSSSVNVGVKASQLPDGFECTLWQQREGLINLIEVESNTVIVPDGKLLQTENIGDSVYFIKKDGKVYVKGNLKDA